jgi:hypothetical protein
MTKRLVLLLGLALVAAAGFALVSTTPTEATTQQAQVTDASNELALAVAGAFSASGGDCLSCVSITTCVGMPQKCDTGAGGPACYCRWCVDHFICDKRN